MNYLVLYDDEGYVYIDAENLRDYIIKFADYVGVATDLFLKALKGCNTPTDYIKMYEHFIGFYPKDLFILLAKNRIVADWQVKNQKTLENIIAIFGCLRNLIKK